MYKRHTTCRFCDLIISLRRIAPIRSQWPSHSVSRLKSLIALVRSATASNVTLVGLSWGLLEVDGEVLRRVQIGDFSPLPSSAPDLDDDRVWPFYMLEREPTNTDMRSYQLTIFKGRGGFDDERDSYSRYYAAQCIVA